MPSEIDFVRDMTAGGSPFSFAELGGQYFGRAGQLGGFAGDMAFRMAYPGHTLMHATGTPFERVRAANNLLAQARMQEMYQRAHTAQTRFMMQSMGLGPHISSLAAQGLNFLGVTPPDAMTPQGISALMYMAADPARNYMITRGGVRSVTRAFESYFNFDYRAQAVRQADGDRSRLPYLTAMEKAQYLRRTGGLGREDVARSLVSLRNLGLLDPGMTAWRREDGRWVDRGVLGRARRVHRQTMGDVEGEVLRRLGVSDRVGFRHTVRRLRAENPDMTETEAREQALSQMGVDAPATYDVMLTRVTEERGGDLFRRYGRQAVLGGPRSLARAMQMEEAKAGPMMQGLRAFKDVGFVGDLHDLVQDLGRQFGQGKALNPNFIKSVAADIRAVKEATGMTFGEIRGMMEVMGGLPGAKAMPASAFSSAMAGGAVLASEKLAGPLSQEARLALTADVVARDAQTLGSPVAGIQRFIAFAGTEADRELLRQVQGLSAAEQLRAYDVLVSGGAYRGRAFSARAQDVSFGLRSGDPARRERVQKFLANVEAVSQREMNRLSGKVNRTPEEERQLSEMLDRQRLVIGAAKAGYEQQAGFVPTDLRERMIKTFGSEQRGMYAMRLMLQNPDIPIEQIGTMMERVGLQGLTREDYAAAAGMALDIVTRGADVESAVIGAGGFYRGDARIRQAMKEAQQILHTTRVHAAEALSLLPEDDKKRTLLRQRLEKETGGLPGFLEMLGIEMTPTTEFVAMGDGILPTQLTGKSMLDENARRELMITHAKTLDFLGTYHTAQRGAEDAERAFVTGLKAYNEQRLQQGKEAITREDIKKKLVPRLGMEDSDLTREDVQLVRDWLFTRTMGGKAQKSYEAMKGIITGYLGTPISDVELREWVAQGAPVLEADLEKGAKKLEEEMKNAVEGGAGAREMMLTGRVQLEQEGDAVYLVFNNKLGNKQGETPKGNK